MDITATILVIDNEFSTRITLAMIFLGAGYSTSIAPDGVSALNELHNHPFSLIYLDFQIPDMDIMEFLPEIRAHFPSIPLVILTANDSPELALMARMVGVKEYLIKPIDPEVILIKTEKILREGQEFSQNIFSNNSFKQPADHLVNDLIIPEA